MPNRTNSKGQRQRKPHVELLTSQGRVLLYVAGHPATTLNDIADALGLSARTVARAVADLRAAGRLARRTTGRRVGYVALADLPGVKPHEPGSSCAGEARD